MEKKLTTFEEVAKTTERQIVQSCLETIRLESTIPLSEMIGRLTAISNRIDSKQLGFEPQLHFDEYANHVTILISKHETDESFNKRVAKLLTQINAKEMREMNKEKQNADRIRLKHDHYLEMKAWALQSGLPL
jgi:hypothetical protein